MIIYRWTPTRSLQVWQVMMEKDSFSRVTQMVHQSNQSVHEPMWNWCQSDCVDSKCPPWDLCLSFVFTSHVLLLSLIGTVFDGIDLCTSRRILMPFPEAEGCFRGFSGPAILAQPGHPALGVQPELWERHCGGVPGLPLHAPLAGQYGPVGEGCWMSLIMCSHNTQWELWHLTARLITVSLHFSKAVVTGVFNNTTRQTWT